MNLRKSSRLSVLCLAMLMPLAACTATEQSSSNESSKNVTLKIARGSLPVERALAEVYKNSLEAKGYTATINKSTDDPYGQVQEGQADIAVDQAGAALFLSQDSASITGQDGVLSVDELKKLRTEINDAGDEIQALDLSSANAGNELVMSNAEALTHQVDSLSSLAKACGDLTIITDEKQTDDLKRGLKAEGCATPKISVVESADLATQLRASVDRAVAISAGSSIISDEGFKSISDSAKLFDAQPYMLLVNNNVDDKAQNELNKVTGELSQQSLVDLNRMVTAPGATEPQQAAARWEWIIE